MEHEHSALPALLATEKDYRYSYGIYVIGVSKQYPHDLEALLRNQRRAIDLGALYPVTECTKDHVLGWPFDDPGLACAHINIPPTERDALEYDPISYTAREGNVVSGFFIIPNNKCWTIPDSRHCISFDDLDKISFKT
jgi:hypothetical protein